MAQTNINIRTDEELKRQAEQLFSDLGMNMSTAVNVFLKQVVRCGGIPFEIKVDNTSNTGKAETAQETENHSFVRGAEYYGKKRQSEDSNT